MNNGVKRYASEDQIIRSWNELEDRPFYEEEIGGELFLDVEMDEQEINDCATFLQLGETYKVTVGTEEYILEAQSALNATLFGGEYIYLGSAMTSRGLDGDYSFSIYKALEIDANGVHLDTTPEQPILIKVEGLTNTEIHHLDPKYIKDMYYEEIIETTMLNDVSFIATEESPVGFYGAINDFTLDADKFVIGEICNIHYNGSIYECVIGGSVTNSIFELGNPILVGETEDNGMPFYIVIISGETININTSESVESGTLKITKSSKNVVQLDEKYIPSTISREGHIHSYNDLEDKPFYEETVILCENVIAHGYGSDPGVTLIGFPVTIVFETGKEYKVVINEYENVAIAESEDRLTFEDNGATVYTNNTDDHIIFYIPDTTSLIDALIFNNEDKLSIYEYENIVHQLNEKFIPDTIARVDYVDNAVASNEAVFTVNITQNEDGSYSTDKTFDEILEDYESGKVVIIKDAYSYFSIKYMDEEYLSALDDEVTYVNDNSDHRQIYTYGYKIYSDGTIEFIDTGVKLFNSDFLRENFYYDLTTSDKTVFGAINELNAKHTEGTDALILLSPNGTKFNITVGDDGVLTATEITE